MAEHNSLIKVLVNSGIGSRRKCFELIKEGRISVNNQIILDPLYEIDTEKEKIKLDDQEIKINVYEPVYIMMYKPEGVICSRVNEKGLPTVFDLIKHKRLKKLNLFYAGRLDVNSEGLIFLTNDGEFTQLITHPKYQVPKYYIVEIKKEILPEHIEKMKKGVYLGKEKYKVDEVKVLKKRHKYTRLLLKLTEGKNREIRKIFQVLKYKIKLLRRVKIGDFALDPSLKPGEYRLISKKEIEKFKSKVINK